MWYFENKEFDVVPDGYVGYVYIITNLTSNKRYIGKKNFYFSKTKQVKGKKKKFKIESDWKEYYGSNKELSQDVLELGKDSFKREILRLCISKGEFSYFESKYQFEYGVLETDGWYNGHIMCRVHKKHLIYLKK